MTFNSLTNSVKAQPSWIFSSSSLDYRLEWELKHIIHTYPYNDGYMYIWWEYVSVTFPPLFIMTYSHLVGIWRVGICWVTMMMTMRATSSSNVGQWLKCPARILSTAPAVMIDSNEQTSGFRHHHHRHHYCHCYIQLWWLCLVHSTFLNSVALSQSIHRRLWQWRNCCALLLTCIVMIGLYDRNWRGKGLKNVS